MENIKLVTEHLKGFVSDSELKEISDSIKLVHKSIKKKECPGNEYLGWLDLPDLVHSSLLKSIERTAMQVRKNCDVFLSLGIGGSYLGARAGIEFLKPAFFNEFSTHKPKIYFAGHNLSADYLTDLLKLIKGKKVVVNVISKSGTTTETAVAFRIIKQCLEKFYGNKNIKDKIICTTDKKKGALRKLAEQEGYKSFVIADDIGGRFSVLSPVGLFPLAVAGIDISELLKGAAACRKQTESLDLNKNTAYKYAAIRHILYAKGKKIEILANFHPAVHFVGEWWKQLFGESEGKNHKGIFPACCDFSTDLHSLGQMIQEGERNLFETFLLIKNSTNKMQIPQLKDDLDGLNYLAGRTIDYINQKAYEGTASAHYEGGVPNMSLIVPERSAFYLGELFYFFEKAVAVSGLLLGVNPFNQPGVEAYKKKMFKLLGK
ncbi:MAG: glucose-6-phosphate isomerase [Candidatus Omnitrophota bacterium]|nr:MAG: glucose-6-phosphate isomerase [Candidatus Omnitrophota bacterium]